MDLLGFTLPSLNDLLSEDDLATLAERSVRTRFDDGQQLHARGDPRSRFSIVVEGAVRFVRRRRDGRQITTITLGPGQFFGGFPLGQGAARTHDAVAVGPTAVDQMTGAEFDRLIEEKPAILRAMFEMNSHRLEALTELYDDARMSPPAVRIAKLFLLATRSESAPQRIECLQEDIGQALGLSAVTVAQSLRRLAEAGFIATRYRAIEVLDREKLAAFVRSEE
jgi:CRP-like cAMP-binding protein